ncbi:MAG TPA: methylated-DNA--[protein]-cysteine S-methyltransferase [Solirubrobacteraceae bacterium]
MNEITTICTMYCSPLGPLTLTGGANGRLNAVRFPGAGAPDGADFRPGAFETAIAQLDEYFAGARREFELELELNGTPFQQRVWDALRAIPYGTTISYGELARIIGRPDRVRAVGSAVGATPVPIIVPCHRVIGADGSLTGYGGGLARKRALLELEGAGWGAARGVSAGQLSLV